jgi:hypothetical protein
MQVKFGHLQDWVNTKAWARSSRVATLPAKVLSSIRACSSAQLTIDPTREIAIRHVANKELLRQKPPGSPTIPQIMASGMKWSPHFISPEPY